MFPELVYFQTTNIHNSLRALLTVTNYLNVFTYLITYFSARAVHCVLLYRHQWRMCPARWWRHTWRAQPVTLLSANDNWKLHLMRLRNKTVLSSSEETWTYETKRYTDAASEVVILPLPVIYRAPTGQGKLEKVREFEWSGKVQWKIFFLEKSGKKYKGNITPSKQ